MNFIEQVLQFIINLPPFIINIGVILSIIGVLSPFLVLIIRKIKSKYLYWEKWGKYSKKVHTHERIDYIVASIDNGTSEIVEEDEYNPEEE